MSTMRLLDFTDSRTLSQFTLGEKDKLYLRHLRRKLRYQEIHSKKVRQIMLKKIVLKMLRRKTPAFVRNGGNESKTAKSEEKRSF